VVEDLPSSNGCDTHASGSPDPIGLREAANYELSQSSLPVAGTSPSCKSGKPPPRLGLCVETHQPVGHPTSKGISGTLLFMLLLPVFPKPAHAQNSAALTLQEAVQMQT
jgi:hypothetical protein